ncbi:MAG: hypothetical protein EOP52_04460 [Sphingobacteriales bacterium]|nr:MAG: hypothetical protein EOP52_04460 [Sphingobacteriales bacterium]
MNMLRALLLVLMIIACGLPGRAQQPATASGSAPVQPILRNFKVLEEFPDGKGNIVRKVQYDEGIMRVRQTIIMPIPVKMGQLVKVNTDTLKKDKVMLLIDKSDYSVQVYYNKRAIRNYKAVFGPRPQDDKCREGDRCTPEGSFTIQNMNPRSQYNKFMLLSYPTDSSRIRFAKLKSQGLLPASATIGHSIGIHGIWPGGDDMIEMGVGWTDGCIALRNRDVDELYSLVGVGTKVFIRK